MSRGKLALAEGIIMGFRYRGLGFCITTAV
jgi:hypothetical protein